MQTDHHNSEPGEQASLSSFGSDAIRRATEGHFTLGIEAVLTEAWALTAGHKLKLNMAVAIYSVISIVVAVLVGGCRLSRLIACYSRLRESWSMPGSRCRSQWACLPSALSVLRVERY